MLLDSNILIYGAQGGHPGLDAILGRTDLAVASVTRIETPVFIVFPPLNGIGSKSHLPGCAS